MENHQRIIVMHQELPTLKKIKELGKFDLFIVECDEVYKKILI